jgi:hypothetical protein
MTAALKINSITCIDQNEISQDEPYLDFNGQRIWSGNMSQGDTVNLSSVGPFIFEGSASLSLFEDDGNHWYDHNDYLGTYTISEAQAPAGVFSLDFALDGHYRLDVDVMSLTFG